MTRRASSGLRSGAAIVAGLVLLALLAPLLATERPWLARGTAGVHSPALRHLLGTRGEAGAEALLSAPVPHDPVDLDLEAVLAPPSAGHWMGTDALGRDLVARIVHGTRVSLGVGMLTALMALLVGLPLGALAGYAGGWADAVVSRLVEGFLCFPTLLVALAVLGMSPAWLAPLPDVVRIALVLAATSWIPVARYLRGEFLRLRGSEMVLAARASGAGHLRIVAGHILPAALAPVLVTASFTVGAAILIEAALSFIGIGVSPPTPTWGGLLREAWTHVHEAWWLALFPGGALFLAVLGCNLLGEGIRDRLDPRAPRP